ncbi:MAG: hypothetical protein AAF560_33775, partial [Acidobacteriota bacterium]
MNLEHQEQPKESDPQPAVVIIDDRPADGELGLFSRPVKPGGVVHFSTTVEKTYVEFLDGSPLEGPNPRPIPKEGVTVQVAADAQTRTYPFVLGAAGSAIKQLQLQVSINNPLQSNGFSVLSTTLVGVRVPGSLDGSQVTVLFNNVTAVTHYLEVTPVGQPSFIATVEPLNPKDPPEQVVLTPESNAGMIAVIRLLDSKSTVLETGGTEQAD